MGEDTLATRLVVASPVDALDPELGNLVLARSAVVRGRPQDAVDLLEDTELGPPADAQAPEVVAAAARASISRGDDDYRWLLAHVSYARRTGEGSIALRLLAAVADARGDTTTADRAWEELVASAGWRTPDALARLAATTVSRRDRDDRFGVPAHALEAAGIALAAPRSPRPDLGPVTDADADADADAATRLAGRGDRAGALLLLRAVRSRARSMGGDARPSAGLRASEAELLPPADRLAYGVQRSGIALLGAGAGVVTVLATSTVWWPLVPVLAVAATLLTRRHVRLGPFTTAERRAWRTLPHSHIDEPTGGVVGRQRDMLGAVVAVVAVLAGIWPAALTLSWMSERLVGWAWLQFVVYMLVMIAPAPPSLALLAWARAALARRTRRRRVARDDSQGLAAVGEGTATARCPLSGVLWLVVPTDAEALLLMRGAMFASEPDPARHDRSFF
ncbi:hypothetical protein [Sanguibacter sp. 25GB23B1]|uniref:hypothetical protein n=1 Tax=unclassified Sanguibacter TaxID=2645534 RepID=UPI0032AF802D